jgi:transcriptional regulator of acetoin/glycerol metabolism
MPRCPFCGYSRPETADIEVPTTCPDPRTLPDGVDSSPSQSSLVGHLLVGTTLRELETLLITATLQGTSGNVKAAAAILGIDRSTMYEKIKRYQIARP